MGGGRRQPRCRGGGPVLPYPIDPSTGVSGFVPVWACSIFSSTCVVVRAWCLQFGGATAGGGAVRARVVRAARSAACLRVLLPCVAAAAAAAACALQLWRWWAYVPWKVRAWRLHDACARCWVLGRGSVRLS